MSIARIKAFTVMEVTITMLLAAIVISITFTAYEIVSRSYAEYYKQHSRLSELIQTDKMLQRDFERAQFILFEDGKLSIRDSTQTIGYIFLPEGIVRSATITDTLHLQLSNLKMNFEKKEVADTSRGKLIDDLSFTILQDQQIFTYHYHKQYSSAELINAGENALY